MGYIIAFILGIVIATVGFTGVANMGDAFVVKTQQVIKESAK